MLLVVDIGNTDVVYGVGRQGDWQHIWRVPSQPRRTASEYGLLLRSFFLENNLKIDRVQRVVLSSVVPPLTPVMQEMLLGLTGQPPLVLGPVVFQQLPMQIAQPHQIGSDLVANAAAAYDRFRSNCLVVDFGTALTFTAIDAKGAIKGVSIAPGLRTAMKALSGNTAQLPEIPLEIPQKAIGTNTVEAIQSGIVLGYVGLVSYLVEKMKEELGGECTVVATGGLSFVMEPLKQVFAHIDPRLTLDGLAVIDRWIHHGA